MEAMTPFRRKRRDTSEKHETSNPPGASRAGTSRARIEWPLVGLIRMLLPAAVRLDGRAISPELLRARIADRLRDAGLEPPPPDRVDPLVKPLGTPHQAPDAPHGAPHDVPHDAPQDADAWRRVALAAAVLEADAAREVVAQLAERIDVLTIVDAFISTGRDLSLLTMAVLRQSPLRIEEFARQLSARLGVGFVGETPRQSADLLHRLDYARLVAEARRARASAEEQMEYLRKLQEEETRRRRPRGKF
jgi:hypothetical protein